MTSENSIECRLSFLDHELVEFAYTIPSKYKVHNMSLRYIQKKALEKKLSPKTINKKKKGFGCPIGRWVKHELYDYIHDLLSEETVKKRGYFEYSHIRKVLADHYANKMDNTDKILSLLSFEIWHQTFLDNY